MPKCETNIMLLVCLKWAVNALNGSGTDLNFFSEIGTRFDGISLACSFGGFMSMQKGFTLIELLLVLAIIGIISAIAIPALLAQRARARDRSCQSNGTSIISELIAAIDRAKGDGVAVDTPADVNANIVGAAAATSRIPVVWQAKNPWNTIAALGAFNLVVGDAMDSQGTGTTASALAAVKGQVQLGFLAPLEGPGGHPGVVASATYLHNTFKSAAGTDTNVWTRIAAID